MERLATSTVHTAFKDVQESLDEDGLLPSIDAGRFRQMWPEDLQRIEAISQLYGVPAPQVHLDMETFLERGLRGAQPLVRRADGTVWKLAPEGWSPARPEAMPGPAAASETPVPRDEFDWTEPDVEALQAENALLREQVQRYQQVLRETPLFDERPEDLSITS